MSIDATTETAIFERIVLVNESATIQRAAESVLAMDFSGEDRQRMQILADKAKQGALTAEEEQAIENYERVGHFLSILQAKARIALRAATGAKS
jgi:hypothetical protein